MSNWNYHVKNIETIKQKYKQILLDLYITTDYDIDSMEIFTETHDLDFYVDLVNILLEKLEHKKK